MIKVFAILCSLSTGQCFDRLVASSETDSTLTMSACMSAPWKFMQWLEDSGALHTNRFGGWRCQIGERGRGI